MQEMMSRLGQLPGQQAISGLAQRQMVPQALPQELPPEMMAERMMPGMTVGELARGAATSLPIRGTSVNVQNMLRGIEQRDPVSAAMSGLGLAFPFLPGGTVFHGSPVGVASQLRRLGLPGAEYADLLKRRAGGEV